MKSKFLIVFISAWLFMTIAVDMIVLPQAFKTIGDVWLAGTLGIAIFRHFNPLELSLSILILGLYVWEEKRWRWTMILPILLCLIAGLYQFYLSPNITSATRVILSLKGQSGPLMVEAQLNHHWYHTSYIRLDVLKLLCLLLFLGIIIKPSKNGEKRNGL